MRLLPVRNGPFLWLAVLVCPSAAGFMGWFGGLTATLFKLQWGLSFADIRECGMLVGMLAGLVASLAWCALMIVVAVRALLRTGRASPRLVAWGAFAGHAAALLATGTLYATMMALAGRWPRDAVLFALVFSAVAGLAFGAICGLLTWGAAALAMRGQGT